MGKKYFANAPSKEGTRKDTIEGPPGISKDKADPIKVEAEDREQYCEMEMKSITDLDTKEEEITFNEEKPSDGKESHHFVMDLHEEIIKERASQERTYSEKMEFIDSILASLNDLSQTLFNHPLTSMENIAMTEITHFKKEEYAEQEDDDEDEEEMPKKPSYVRFSDNLIKKNGMYFFEVLIMNRKHLVGAYSCPQAAYSTIKRFKERSKHMNVSAFLRELKNVTRYLATRNKYKTG